MKTLISFILCTFFMLPAKASVELLEEVNTSYITTSRSFNEKDLLSDSVINKISLASHSSKVSMEDWLLYAKLINNKKKNEENLEEIESINFGVIDKFIQIFSAYQNEPIETLDEAFKNAFLRSWWIAALVDEDTRTSLKEAYVSGKNSLVEKNEMAHDLLNNIEIFFAL